MKMGLEVVCRKNKVGRYFFIERVELTRGSYYNRHTACPQCSVLYVFLTTRLIILAQPDLLAALYDVSPDPPLSAVFLMLWIPKNSRHFLLAPGSESLC